MDRYNYREAVKKDIIQYLKDQGISVTSSNREDLQESLYDTLFITDSVTGNASGSYTFNTWQAEENLCHNWDLMEEAGNELGYDSDVLARGAEYLDVMIRCYLLSSVLSEVLDELEEDDDENSSEE